MDEVFEIADRITILRDGRWISDRQTGRATPGTSPSATWSGATSATSSSARRHEPGDGRPRGARPGPRGRLRRDQLRRSGRGEVLGFAGLVGARRTDVGLALFGMAPADSGAIVLDGQPVRISQPERGNAAPDRLRHRGPPTASASSLPLSIAANMSLPSLSRYLGRLGLVKRGRGGGHRARAYPRAAEHPDRVDREPGRFAVGRQPAEGDAGQVARTRTRGCSSSTSRRAGSTSGRRPRCIGSSTSWRRTGWPSS